MCYAFLFSLKNPHSLPSKALRRFLSEVRGILYSIMVAVHCMEILKCHMDPTNPNICCILMQNKNKFNNWKKD